MLKDIYIITKNYKLYITFYSNLSIWNYTSFSHRQMRKAESFVLKWLLNRVF